MPNNLDFRAAVMKELWARGMTIKELARAIHYSRGHLSGVINGKIDSPDAESAIRSYLNITAA